jgi:putative tryptophan/tyrosine transport system substrate-binding protein
MARRPVDLEARVLWHGASTEEEKVPLGHLQHGLRDLGYFEGQNIVVENRFPAEQPERFLALAKELAQLDLDVLVAVNRPTSAAVHQATTTIPIVFIDPDPVGDALVKSLAHPGGNLTGLSTMAVELTAKRVELLKEAMGGLKCIGVMVNAGDPQGAHRYVQAGRSAALSLGLSVESIEIKAAEDLERAFANIEQRRIEGVVLAQDGLLYVNREQIGKLALQHHVATVVYSKDMLEAGALISYAPSYPLIFYRVAYFVDRILKGAKPAELPVEQPTKFELLINERTAKALGLSLPPSLLARADEVIE